MLYNVIGNFENMCVPYKWYIHYDIVLFLQVTLPVAITPRWGHSAVVFGSGASFRVVVLFGGRKSWLGGEISEQRGTLTGPELSRVREG